MAFVLGHLNDGITTLYGKFASKEYILAVEEIKITFIIKNKYVYYLKKYLVIYGLVVVLVIYIFALPST